MITARRSAAAAYSTDPVAQDLRSFVATSTRMDRANGPAAASASAAAFDVALLYPNLYAPAARPWSLVRAALTAIVELEAAVVTTVVRRYY